MTVNEIIEELGEVFEGSPWYGNSLSAYFQQIHPAMLNHSHLDGHSIGQILEHMIVWREFVLDKLDGKLNTMEVGGDLDWAGRVYSLEDKNALYSRLRSTQKQLLEKLRTKEDNLLTNAVPDKAYTYGYLLKGLVQHDIYHIGQLFLLISGAKKVP